ncbi:tetratricopeptide repeat protein [Streptomyces goshikiensis]|uniref:tetratricopeptide repeat protein n=1 Tax=Streptomyces goshikiensis TaxID=1942 RepID=UPI00369AE779
MNALGAESGLVLRYQRPSVAQWLNGTRPRNPVPQLVAEAFSRRLGRPVSVTDAGWAAGDEGGRSMVCPQPPDSPSDLIDLARGALQEGTEPLTLYSTAALRECLHEAAYRNLSPPRVPPKTRRVGKAEIGGARAMLGLFSELDRIHGGGHIRAPLASYLATTIAPWLQSQSGPSVREELLTAASQLAYLCAFAHFDEGRQGTSQRYYRTALSLASEAGSEKEMSLTLRGLSVQAYCLGHFSEAKSLADAAIDRAGTEPPAYRLAALVGQQAVATAAVGSRRDALAQLIRAEGILGRTPDTVSPVGAYHHASLAHQQAEVRAALGDTPGALAALRTSVRIRPPDERRSRALVLNRLAELQLRLGHVEAACATWQLFLGEYPSLRSHRSDAAIASMRSLVRPYSGNHAVTALLIKAGTLSTGLPSH